MKLSTKGRYGLKAMVDLASGYGCGTRSVSALASSQGISEAYLERIISALKKSGLVTSLRGASGGYTLSRDPEDISVGEILRALEGSTSIVDCVSVGASAECSNACQCSTRPLWLKLQRKIDDVLDQTTLKDMADDYMSQLEHINQINQLTNANNKDYGKADKI